MPLLMEEFYKPQIQKAQLADYQSLARKRGVEAEQAEMQMEEEKTANEYLRSLAQKAPTEAIKLPDGTIQSPEISRLEEALKGSPNYTVYTRLSKQLTDAKDKESKIAMRNENIDIKDRQEKASIAQAGIEMKSSMGLHMTVDALKKDFPEDAQRLDEIFKHFNYQYTPQVESFLKAAVARNIGAVETLKNNATLAKAEENHIKNTQLEQNRLRDDSRTETNQAFMREIASERLQLAKKKADQVKARERKIGRLSDKTEVERTSSELKGDLPKLDLATRDRMAEDIRTKQKEHMLSDESLSAGDAYEDAYDAILSKVKTTGGFTVPILGTFGEKQEYQSISAGEPAAPAKFETGKVYKDAAGNKAKYVNGKWEAVK